MPSMLSHLKTKNCLMSLWLLLPCCGCGDGMDLQFPALLTPFFLSVSREAPRSQRGLPALTFQHFVTEVSGKVTPTSTSMGWAYYPVWAVPSMSCSTLEFIGLPATSACLWLQIHRRMKGLEKAVTHLEHSFKKGPSHFQVHLMISSVV